MKSSKYYHGVRAFSRETEREDSDEDLGAFKVLQLQNRIFA